MPTVTRRTAIGTGIGIVAVAAVGTVFAYRQSSIGATLVPSGAITTKALTSTSLLIGARAKNPSGSLATAFTDAAARLGPLQVTRVFYGSLPARHIRISPSTVLEIISYKSSAGSANLTSFAKSLTHGEMMTLHHEPEGPTDYASGAQFISAFTTDYNIVHPLGVPFGMIAGAYQYRAKGRGYNGSYIPSTADFYAVDTYRDGSREVGYGAIVPLTQVAEFQRWYSLVQGKGKPLMVTEYGRGTVGNGEVASTPTKRLAVLPMDIQWLRDHGFSAFALWFSNSGPDGRAWIPTDAGYYTAFNAIVRG